MKQVFVALSGLAWLRVASAACCRNNQCLKAIVQVAENGVEDCSSLLAVTVTNAQSTFTETSTVVPTEFNTIVDTAVVTQIETSVASTETRIVSTVSVTVTPTTRTNIVTETETVTETATNSETTTITTAAATTITMMAPKKRGDTLHSPDPAPSTSPVPDAPALPEYASTVCPSWERYTSACKCAGAVPTTITVDAPVATVTEEVTSTVTNPVLSTLLTTTTEILSITETISDTETETALVTASTVTTKTEQVTASTTVTETTTQTVLPPVASCTVRAGAAFKAAATEYNNQPLLVYANLLNGLTGGLTWNAASTSTAPSVQNKYIWSLDSNGYLNVAFNVPPYTYKYYAYMSTGSSGSNWPQVNTEASVNAQVNNGGAVTKIKGCVDSITGELKLNAAGRTNILWCGQQLWMSAGLGEDINRGTCSLMKPKVEWV